MAYVRPVLQLRNCGTSSRQAANLNPTKSSADGWSKLNTDAMWSLFWKSVALASSILKPVKSYTVESTTKLVEKVTDSKKANTSNLDVGQSLEKNSSTTSKVTDTTSELERSFFEWISGGSLQGKEIIEKPKPKPKQVVKRLVSEQSSVEQRSRFLVHSLLTATTPATQLSGLQKICRHLMLFPREKANMINEGLIQNVLWVRKRSLDSFAKLEANVILSFVGHHDPPSGNGIRILSIDGGGTRGLMAVEILRHLESKTGQKVHQLFDYMCGVSSGAILCLLLGGLRLSLDECEHLYKRLSLEVFNQSPIWGTGNLMWNHAYYDTTAWVEVLKGVFGDRGMLDTIGERETPKLAAVSAVMNLPRLQAYVFRNYDFLPASSSQYLGSCTYTMWEAIRASGAAPGYFEELPLDGYLHQDGGVLLNNPTALGIHESHLLWPNEKIQCVISIGSGRYTPFTTTTAAVTSTNLKTKILKIIDSATDTEGVHIILKDLLSSNTYFRLNPDLTEFLTLDENRPEKLQQLKLDAQMYIRVDEDNIEKALVKLTKPRNSTKKLNDWLHLQKSVFL